MTKSSNREAIFAALDRGDSRAKIIADFGISKQAVSVWAKKYEQSIAVNASVDQSTPESHEWNGNRSATHLEPLERIEAKADRGDGRDASGRFAEDRVTKAQKLAVMIETLELGTSRTAAYAIAGIPESTAALWFQRDEEFRAAVLEAESRVETKVANALYLYAISGKVGSHIAAAIFLERNPATGNRWRRRDRLEIEGRVVHVGLDESMRRIMLSSAAIQAASALEVALQNADQDARSLPAHPDAIDADFREVVSES
jgi:hypothetical protein